MSVRRANALIHGRFELDEKTDMLYDTKKEVGPFGRSRLDEIARLLLVESLKELAELIKSRCEVKKR